MLDFVKIRTVTREARKGSEPKVTIYPEFIVGSNHNDLMIRGGDFYAVWDERTGLWSKNPMVVGEVVDKALRDKKESFPEDARIECQYLSDFSSKRWSEFLSYCRSLPDNYHELDDKVTFSDEEIAKTDYVSKRLPYSLDPLGKTDAYDELVGTLYLADERRKIEWAVGSILAGESGKAQKFVVLYGDAGSGKSTMLNIIQMLFEGYYNIFDARALASAGNAFSLEVFRDNPLVSIQHDGDLSKIEDNTKLNSLVSHEEIVVNEKRKTQYITKFRTFLFLGTNKPVKITDARAGIIRRLLDVRPSGEKVPFSRYHILMSQIRFELGAIAYKCLSVFNELGPNAYDKYRPLEMLGTTNDFYNFMEDQYSLFSKNDYTTLAQAWSLYKEWADEVDLKYRMGRKTVESELKAYFHEYMPEFHSPNGEHVRKYYRGFEKDKFRYFTAEDLKLANQPQEFEGKLVLDKTQSIFDKEYSAAPAQYATESGTPKLAWSKVKTTLEDINTNEEHFVKLPTSHVVIDFDLKDANGDKSLDLNLEAASKWPESYSELSRSGSGVHIHYVYTGDTSKLAKEYAPGIEIKTFKGNSALRRKLTLCNDKDILTLSSGLPEKKGVSKVLDFDGLKNEKAIRTLIDRNLRKEIHPGTKPSIDFIEKILNDAYSSGMKYDVSDMRSKILAFANNSSHHALYCIKCVSRMKFKSDDISDGVEWEEEDLVFYDVEVFPNLFVMVWKREGDHAPVKMINPSPMEIENLTKYRLVGFNNRRYDNHILYARMLGFSNAELYDLSQKIISGGKNCMFGEAYNLSYADVYDFSSKKQSLKKFEIELGIHHQELGLPWDKPVADDMWPIVAKYCVNDVEATEAVFNARHEDFMARCLLADLSGKRVNDTTRQHATKIIFGNDNNPQKQFVYTDLATGEQFPEVDPVIFAGHPVKNEFPGYEFKMLEDGKPHNIYRGVDVGRGGYVYAEPGIYDDVVVLDIASMHPTSIVCLDLFGDKYTKVFKDILDSRLLIKHKDYELASEMFNGKLKPYLNDKDEASKLAYALKIIINSIYGFTSATFDNSFKDPRNKNNIVALRGALFMKTLQDAVVEQGYSVVHIKTDSIKIPSYDDKIIDFVMKFGEDYGYTFEIEDIYKKFCLVNDAVYIARDDKGKWNATGAQFQIPYVFKKLFSKEDILFKDLCETRSVTSGYMYLDLADDPNTIHHNYKFVGAVGEFCPMMPDSGGGILYRMKDDKYYAVTGTKGYHWLESEVVKNLKLEDKIDLSYYDKLCREAIKTINAYGSFEEFVKE